MRPSDEARERAAEALRAHYAEGRLDDAELERRVELAYAARTRADLKALFRDLPWDPRSRDRRDGFWRFQRSMLRTHAAAYVGVNGGLVGIWALTGGGEFWPAESIAGWGAVPRRALGGPARGAAAARHQRSATPAGQAACLRRAAVGALLEPHEPAPRRRHSSDCGRTRTRPLRPAGSRAASRRRRTARGSRRGSRDSFVRRRSRSPPRSRSGPCADPNYAPRPRAMTICCTSSVPSPMVRIFASR